MKNFIATLLLTLSISATCKAESFIEGMEDIPLAPHLTQIAPQNFSFGNEETRIIEAYFKSDKTTSDKVESFYLDSLNQLGWTFKGKTKNIIIFERNQEELDIITENLKPLLIRVTLTGKP